MFPYDETMILILLAMGLAMWAQHGMMRAYRQYANVRAQSGLTGAAMAQQILYRAGVGDVQIAHIQGNLTDNYNPQTKVLSLSDGVYAQDSIAALGIAAHECGHAIQHSLGYAPLKLRTAIVPAAQIGSQLSWPIFLGGLFFSWQPLVWLGIWLYVAAVAFTLLVLPVEFDASRRALLALSGSGLMEEDELGGAKKVLRAAAMTYVASAIGALLQLARLLMLANRGRRRD